MTTTIQPRFSACIEACQICVASCGSCYRALADQANREACLRSCIECIDVCQKVILALVLDSQFSQRYCSLCAEVCSWCAEECEKLGPLYCKICADSCRRCAEVCLSMAA